MRQEPDRQRGYRQRQMRYIRANALLQRPIARSREQPQVGTEQQDQQQPPKELRHRQPDDRKAGREMIDNAATPYRSDDTQRDPESDGLSSRLGDVETGGAPFLRDQLGGCPDTARAASGM